MAQPDKHQQHPSSKVTKKGPSEQPAVAVKIKEDQLWQDFQSGNEEAYAAIYEQNAAKLYSYGMKLLRDENIVKDAIQDLFVELWDAKGRLGKVQAITPYLLKSIRRKILHSATRERRTTTLEETDLFIQVIPSAEHNLVERQQYDRKRQEIREALAKLNKNQQEIIHLKYYCRISYQEIAEIMESDTKSVYNLMARTVKQLRKYLDLYPFFWLLLSIL
ncbi:sigma-70 family RNA polymerase sigma factor [Galbibacter sp. PAP.153]|uniref:RNA polymerase sigma factor n=1 Tax=Galbibacter sp. PAP.153 TaxID=3104623 RepID=UPI003008C8FE